MFRVNEKSLPRCFARFPGFKPGDLVAECDIFPQPHGRLAAKLLIFRNNTALRRFWSQVLGKGELGRDCLGVVNSLIHSKQRFDRKGPVGPEIIMADARYFCVIGLLVKHLTLEIIAHEATHAGYSYHKRVTRNPWGKVGDFDEEQVCWPTGRITAAINDFIHAKKLYDWKP